jgi:hypothetical protein
MHDKQAEPVADVQEATLRSESNTLSVTSPCDPPQVELTNMPQERSGAQRMTFRSRAHLLDFAILTPPPVEERPRLAWPGLKGVWLGLLLSICSPWATALATESSTAEEVIRTVVRANAEKDLATMSQLMAHDDDCINYTIGGRKYVGWSKLETDLQEEFETVASLEIPIHKLTVWTRGEIAWFTMEIDYIRYLGQGANQILHVLPLRETGVLERRNGSWILVAWHESFRNPGLDVPGTGLSKTRR